MKCVRTSGHSCCASSYPSICVDLIIVFPFALLLVSSALSTGAGTASTARATPRPPSTCGYGAVQHTSSSTCAALPGATRCGSPSSTISSTILSQACNSLPLLRRVRPQSHQPTACTVWPVTTAVPAAGTTLPLCAGSKMSGTCAMTTRSG